MSPSSITETQSPTVEELVTAFKRRGHFDTLRKATLSSFQGGVSLTLFFFWIFSLKGKSSPPTSEILYVPRLKRTQIFFTEIGQKVLF